MHMAKTTERDLRQQLMHLTLGYWRSQVLFSAVELGIFEALRDGGLSSASIASRCGSSPPYTERLLHACVNLGLLAREGDTFTCTPLASTALLPGAPGYVGDWVGFMGECYRAWGGLEEAIRTGKPVESGVEQLSSGAGFTRRLILAMDQYGQGPGRQLASRIDLSGRVRLLDLGGGAGTYSMLLAERFPELRPVIFDLPPVAEIAREVIAERGFSTRVEVRSGDYLSDDIGDGYDVVLLSNMLHQEDPETCKLLLGKARRALRPGGLLIVNSAVLGPDRAGPEWSVLMSLQLLLFYRGGRVYTGEELVQMLEETGFEAVQVRKVSLLGAETLLLATNPPVPNPATPQPLALAQT